MNKWKNESIHGSSPGCFKTEIMCFGFPEDISLPKCLGLQSQIWEWVSERGKRKWKSATGHIFLYLN